MSANFGTNEKILEVGLSGPEAQPKLRMQNAPEVNVHASAASDAGPSNPLHTQPKTTCFGFRRRSKKLGADPVMWVKNPAAEEVKQPTPTHKLKSPKRDRQISCGARDILCSLGSDIFESHQRSEPQTHQVEQHRADKAVALVSKDSARSVETTPTPKIMASYDSIFVETQKRGQLPGPESWRSRARDKDGADSIADSIEDEGYDTFGTPQWTIDPHDIFFISKGDGSNKVCRLGKGEFGPVYLGVWQEQEVAVKLARQTPISLKTERQFQANVALLHGLNHPNIVAFLGACCWKGGKRSVMVTEFMDKSDLRTLLGRPDLAPKFAWREHGQTVALDVAHGLEYLHDRGIAHGRLKCGNVLMNKAGVAKISDVSLSNLLSHCKTMSGERLMRSSCSIDVNLGSEVTPPEGVTEGGTLAADIFALGLVLHELLTLQRPSSNLLRPVKTPEEGPAKIAYLVECCLDEDPRARPTIKRVVSILSGRK